MATTFKNACSSIHKPYRSSFCANKMFGFPYESIFLKTKVVSPRRIRTVQLLFVASNDHACQPYFKSAVASVLAGLVFGWGVASSVEMNQAKPEGCTLLIVQAAGFEYGYPSSWLMEKVRGIEVLVHDKAVPEMNMTISTGPALPQSLSTAEEVGMAVIARYKSNPLVKQVDLVHVDLEHFRNGISTLTVEVRVDASEKVRHLLSRIVRTKRKVYALTIQVPEELWQENQQCTMTVINQLKPT